MKTIQFNVPSITCSVCSGKIQKGIKSLKGIENVSIDLKSQMVNVAYNPQDVEAREIKGKVSSMGYEVVS